MILISYVTVEQLTGGILVVTERTLLCQTRAREQHSDEEIVEVHDE